MTTGFDITSNNPVPISSTPIPGGGTALCVNVSSGSGTGVGAQQVQGTVASGSTAVGNPVEVAGVDSGGLAHAIAVDANGILVDAPDIYLVGQSGLSAAVNNILIPGTAGSAWTDCTGYRSGSIQLISSATGGTAVFECSNDGINAITGGQVINLALNTAVTGGSIGFNSSAGNTILYFPITSRYIRLRISIAIPSGSTQAITKLSQVPFATAVPLVVPNGAVAHSAVSTANPVLIGGKVTSTLDTTLVNGDLSDLFNTTAGQLIIKSFGSAENDWSYAAASGGILNTTAAVTIKAAGAASIKNYITGFDLMSEALGAATEFVIRNGAAGTVIFRTKIPSTGMALTNIQFDSPLESSAATLLEVATLTASITGAVYFNACGYQSF